VKGAAIELALRGVTVNNIQPGPTTTDMTKEHTRTRIAVHPAGPDGQDARGRGAGHLSGERGGRFHRRQRDDRRRLFCLGPKS